MFELINLFFNRKKRLAFTVPEFAHANKELLIIVCDPKTDEIVVCYKDKHVKGHIKSVTGKKIGVVRNLLTESQFEKHIDGFLSSMVETLKVNLKAGGHFYKFLDGALFAISRKSRDLKESKGVASPPI